MVLGAYVDGAVVPNVVVVIRKYPNDFCLGGHERTFLKHTCNKRKKKKRKKNDCTWNVRIYLKMRKRLC